ncbi:cora-domain-containing protein [Saccharata proteae CBS 121410]|uniref:Cora-domain-containing protein n=1 Tax=Saccharata proteae CBS 121410 TaxID=1314787 RepID=A0A9P4HY93_9PEZI|nr:cora-domain-containing protein [Saccharata proteae CBS 121410]
MTAATTTAPSSSAQAPPQLVSQESSSTSKQKRKGHRAGKKRRRRQSFAAPSDTDPTSMVERSARPSLADVSSEQATRSSFYRLGSNRSNTSLESEALLDHRIHQNFFSPRTSVPLNRASPGHRQSSAAYPFPGRNSSKSKLSKAERMQDGGNDDEEDEDDDDDDRTPLMPQRESPRGGSGYGGMSASTSTVRFSDRSRRKSTASSASSKRKRPGSRPGITKNKSNGSFQDDYDVNNPPSVPGSPGLEADMGFDDVMLTGDLTRTKSRESDRKQNSRDLLIDIDEEAVSNGACSSSTSLDLATERRRAEEHPAERDVCFPQDQISEFGGLEDYAHVPEGPLRGRRGRRRRPWPNLSVLEEWSAEEKEQRTIEGIRARKVSEPLLVDGRLRPQKRAWHRHDEDAPFRFTYFNEEFQSTLHSHTLSELVQEGQTFRELFIPDPPVLSEDDGSDDDEEGMRFSNGTSDRKFMSPSGDSQRESRQGSHQISRQDSRISNNNGKQQSSGEQTGESTPAMPPTSGHKEKRYGPRPVFWLDVLNPTEAEMKVITRTFGIHPLTHEDVMMQEAREKVELFHNYYFVNYRTFEQDTNSDDYLEPVNIYFVVFREGVISIHFSMCPHMANVRRRIRQLRDYLILSSDWIAYAIIDDITDVYAPLIERIEQEVDDIDDQILRLHNATENTDGKPKTKGKDKELEYEKQDGEDATAGDSGGDMLRRVGECRKKVMALYRLLGNKADVIKGFAKRCNEQWEVAPKTEIGLYLGDIQDHIVTMTGNLSHYESLLSRAHGNYLAQINIRMNERAEQTNDVLGKLTVLGTIVLPMNIITGMWGMNVQVPGQEVENLFWFWGITAFLILFGVTCFFICKRYLQMTWL